MLTNDDGEECQLATCLRRAAPAKVKVTVILRAGERPLDVAFGEVNRFAEVVPT